MNPLESKQTYQEYVEKNRLIPLYLKIALMLFGLEGLFVQLDKLYLIFAKNVVLILPHLAL